MPLGIITATDVFDNRPALSYGAVAGRANHPGAGCAIAAPVDSDWAAVLARGS